MSLIDLGQWGRLQVVIDDEDVTFFRDIPTLVQSWSSGDPFDDATAVINFPQISPFEVLGAADLRWLRAHVLVDINRVAPNGDVEALWEGMIASIDTDLSESSGSVTVECIGALYQLDYYVRTPLNLGISDARLYEHAIADEFHPPSDREALRTSACVIEYPAAIDPAVGTGFETRYSGGWESALTGYIQRLLADMVHLPGDDLPTGTSWTLMKNPGRQPVLRIRDQDPIDYTVITGAPGVSFSLKQDRSQTSNVIYGEGTDESDTSWRNAEIIIGGEEDEFETQTVYYPIGWDESVHPAVKDVSENGAPTDPEPDEYSSAYVRIETIQQYGSGVSLEDARRSAALQIRREASPGYVGSITLRSDPAEGSRFSIKAGTNILLRRLHGSGPRMADTFEELLNLGIYLNDNRHDPMTRGQFATVLVKTLEHTLSTTLPTQETSFSDVNGTTHEEGIEKLEAIGAASGFGDGTFRPNDEMTRGQMAGFMLRAARWATGDPLTSEHHYFSDIEGTTHEDDINAAAEHYLIFGNENLTYRPNVSATRYQASTVMQRLDRFLGGTIMAEFEGVYLHVSQAQINFEEGTVNLTVDSKFRDLATLHDLIERQKDLNESPAKKLVANRQSSTTEDTKFPWDYNAGSGSIPKASLAAFKRQALPVSDPTTNPEFFVFVNGSASSTLDRWTFVPVVLAGKGSVQRSEIRAYDSSGNALAIPFHVGVYQYEVTELSVPPNAFTEGAWQNPDASGDPLSGYDSSGIILWGQFGQRAGYWPGLESEGSPVSGILIDDGTWQFQLADNRNILEEGQNVAWLAFYAEQDAYFQGRFYHGVQ